MRTGMGFKFQMSESSFVILVSLPQLRLASGRLNLNHNHVTEIKSWHATVIELSSDGVAAPP